YFLLAFVPVLAAGLWIIIAAQPHTNTFRSHIRTWDSQLGITGAVHSISLWNGVLALGIGLVCGLTMEPGWLLVRRRRAVTPAATPAAVGGRAADKPLADVDRRAAVHERLAGEQRHAVGGPERDDRGRVPATERRARHVGVGRADDRQLAGRR